MNDAPPSSLMDLTMSSKMKTIEGEGVGACSLVHNTLEVEGRARVPRWGLGRLTSKSITHPPSPLQYTMCLATEPTPKCHFVLGLPNGSPEIPKIRTLTNVLLNPLLNPLEGSTT